MLSLCLCSIRPLDSVCVCAVALLGVLAAAIGLSLFHIISTVCEKYMDIFASHCVSVVRCIGVVAVVEAVIIAL